LCLKSTVIIEGALAFIVNGRSGKGFGNPKSEQRLIASTV
jgi:hypothetical protein